ncbi:MAG: hypothetical protein ACREH6_06910, partial [Geminicoccaceae bacterium]
AATVTDRGFHPAAAARRLVSTQAWRSDPLSFAREERWVFQPQVNSLSQARHLVAPMVELSSHPKLSLPNNIMNALIQFSTGNSLAARRAVDLRATRHLNSLDAPASVERVLKI